MLMKTIKVHGRALVLEASQCTCDYYYVPLLHSPANLSCALSLLSWIHPPHPYITQRWEAGCNCFPSGLKTYMGRIDKQDCRVSILAQYSIGS